jgi:hypothetical protein
MKLAVTFSIIIVAAASIMAAQRFTAGDPPAAGQSTGDQTTPAAEGAEKPTTEQVSAEQASPLEELSWMVGDWVDAEEDSTVSTRCSWTQNHKFLTQSFRISVDGKTTLEGEQKIAWDPTENRIRSWVFDSEGGFGEGRWIKDGNRWEVKTTFILAGGERASAVNVYTFVDANSFRWQSIDREIAGELQPGIPEVTVVRRKAGAEGQGNVDTGSKQSEKEASR